MGKMTKGITTATHLLGVVGHGFPKVKGVQAAVQTMFENVFDRYGIDAAYFLFNIAPGDLPAFVAFAKASGMPGFGVTMPHKRAMADLVDDMSPYCKVTGAVNLVTIKDGKAFGDNTDGAGFCGKWDREGISMEGRRVMMIGAGDITETIAYELSDRGAASFHILNRTLEKARRKAEEIRKITGKPATAAPLTDRELDAAAPNADMLVQASALGMLGEDGTITDFEYLGFIDRLPADALVADVIPSPIETTLLKKAVACGHRVSDGADMDSYQTAIAMRAFFGDEYDFDDDVILNISKAALKGFSV